MSKLAKAALVLSGYVVTCLVAKINALRELQSTGGEELSALLPSVLDRALR